MFILEESYFRMFLVGVCLVVVIFRFLLIHRWCTIRTLLTRIYEWIVLNQKTLLGLFMMMLISSIPDVTNDRYTILPYEIEALIPEMSFHYDSDHNKMLDQVVMVSEDVAYWVIDATTKEAMSNRLSMWLNAIEHTKMVLSHSHNSTWYKEWYTLYYSMRQYDHPHYDGTRREMWLGVFRTEFARHLFSYHYLDPNPVIEDS